LRKTFSHEHTPRGNLCFSANNSLLFCSWLLLLKGALVPLTGLDAAASSLHGMVISASDASLTAAQTFMRLLQGSVNNVLLEASKPESRAMFESQDWLALLTIQASFILLPQHAATTLQSNDTHHYVVLTYFWCDYLACIPSASHRKAEAQCSK
jgi:hypothetical protein